MWTFRTGFRLFIVFHPAPEVFLRLSEGFFLALFILKPPLVEIRASVDYGLDAAEA